jgi:hypothetical protein
MMGYGGPVLPPYSRFSSQNETTQVLWKCATSTTYLHTVYTTRNEHRLDSVSSVLRIAFLGSPRLLQLVLYEYMKKTVFQTVFVKLTHSAYWKLNSRGLLTVYVCREVIFKWLGKTFLSQNGFSALWLILESQRLISESRRSSKSLEAHPGDSFLSRGGSPFPQLAAPLSMHFKIVKGTVTWDLDWLKVMLLDGSVPEEEPLVVFKILKCFFNF